VVKRTSGKVADWLCRTRAACAPGKPGDAYNDRRKPAQTAGDDFSKLL
jgi:hypothetical protein